MTAPGNTRTGLRRRLLRLALLATAAGCTFTAATPWVAQLGFDPAAIARGEAWRLLTGHIAHLNGLHAMANALGLGLALTVLAELATPRALFGATLFIAAGIDAVFLLAEFGSGDGFAGFSGLLYGLAALTACLLVRTARAWAVGIAAVTVVSLTAGLSGWSPWGFETATTTHVTGVVLGFFAGAWLRRTATPTAQTTRNR